jgi:hypothetical protein
MSEIEASSKLAMSALVLGSPIRLGPPEQRAVASLLCLISMRVEFMSEMRAVAQADRNFLRRLRSPPHNWRIWIARYSKEGEVADDNWCRYYAAQAISYRIGDVLPRPDKTGGQYCNSQVTTMVIGDLFAHVFSRQAEGLEYEGVEYPPLTRIWPSQAFGIASDHLPVIKGSQVALVHEALARESRPIPDAA